MPRLFKLSAPELWKSKRGLHPNFTGPPCSPTTPQHQTYIATRMANTELSFLQQLLNLKPNVELDGDYIDAVLVCIDCEAWEDDHSKITEIGIAVLDPRDVEGVEPGTNAQHWTPKIKAAHLRFNEHAALVNRKYVKGLEEFFNFGTTYWADLDMSKAVLQRLFEQPAELNMVVSLKDLPSVSPRQVIFVAHDMKTDFRFTDQLGFPLRQARNVVRHVDTQVVAGATKKTKIGLQRLLHALDIEATNLHNAGNDAVYTLQCLIVMAVKDYKESGSVARAVQQVRNIKMPPVSVDDSHPALHVRIEHTQTEAVAEKGKSTTVAALVEDSAQSIQSNPRKRPASDDRLNNGVSGATKVAKNSPSCGQDSVET